MVLILRFLTVSFLIVLASCADRGTESPTAPDGGTEPPPEQGVSFRQEIQPILNTRCAIVGCHIAPNPANGLDLSSYANLMKGAGGVRVVIPNDAQNSTIIKRLEGRETPRMPLVGTPLFAEQITLIRKWIDEGAKEN
ncbi:MAG: hypothetical protein HY709_00100 [Candidatus Latescibacteria bacterium]|nr:hypothetical protein [Candidatus Latescibacterota bacterium]